MSISALGSLVLNLFPSSSTSNNTTANLLGAIYGTGGSSSGVGSTDPVAALNSAEKNQTQDIAAEAAQPSVARDIATFTAAVASAKTPQQLLQNPTVLKVLLTANGLGSYAQYPALAQKALLSDPSDSSSLANQLSQTDSSWGSTVSTYNFATQGLAVLQKPGVVSTIANGYAEVLWRQSLDATTPGLSEALTFKQEASTITSVDQILGDSTLRTVVTTALGIPEQIAFQDLGAQEQAITSKVDISKFKDPTFVAAFTTQYLIAAQQAASSSSSDSSTTDLTTLAAQASSGLVV